MMNKFIIDWVKADGYFQCTNCKEFEKIYYRLIGNPKTNTCRLKVFCGDCSTQRSYSLILDKTE